MSRDGLHTSKLHLISGRLPYLALVFDHGGSFTSDGRRPWLDPGCTFGQMRQQVRQLTR